MEARTWMVPSEKGRHPSGHNLRGSGLLAKILKRDNEEVTPHVQRTKGWRFLDGAILQG